MNTIITTTSATTTTTTSTTTTYTSTTETIDTSDATDTTDTGCTTDTVDSMTNPRTRTRTSGTGDDNAVGGGNGALGDEENSNSNIDTFVLILVMSILFGTFCTIILISKICIDGLNKRKELGIEQEKIQRDILNKRLSVLVNENNANSNKNTKQLDDHKLNGAVNLRATTASVQNNNNNKEMSRIHLKVDKNVINHGDIHMQVGHDVNMIHNKGETDHGIESFSVSSNNEGKTDKKM